MRSLTFLSFAILIISMGYPAQSYAQTYTISESSTMTILGTANVRDWDAEVTSISGEVTLRPVDELDWSQAEASWFEQVEISIPVSEIDSDSRRMNRSMHEYLREDDYPEITYSLSEAHQFVISDNPGYQLKLSGIVQAAGESLEIEHDVEIQELENGGFRVSGSQDLNMTDFGIDPPTAVLGTVRARDEMTIEFELILEK